MSALRFVSAVVLGALEILRTIPAKISLASQPSAPNIDGAYTVVTDITIDFRPQSKASLSKASFDNAVTPARWHRIEKDLYLHTSQQNAWLHVAETSEEELTINDLVVTAIQTEAPPSEDGSDGSWHSRPGGIWIRKSNYTRAMYHAVTGVDVVFGSDAVDPRSEWTLVQPALQLGALPETPIASITVRHGAVKRKPDDPRAPLKVKEGEKIKIVQISDTHMVTGVGICKDAIDARGCPLPDSEADPRTVKFFEEILDSEKPDLVILTGDQLHHDIPDSQSALFKVVAPLIERSVPFAAVFGNHDSEGVYALSRTAQMSLLQDLPFSVCQPGPSEVDGVGNYYLQIFSQEQSQLPLVTLYMLDSHGQILSDQKDPDYDSITKIQIDWFKNTSQALRRARGKNDNQNLSHLSLAFMHIPLPEYAENDLIIRGGHRREPTEGPSFNSHFYNALSSEGIAAVGCGHDHVNDFCALLPQQKHQEPQQDDDPSPRRGPWLCYGGGAGFGGYGSYDGKRYHRRMRVWELDTNTSSIKTWKRVECAKERFDELLLIEKGKVVVTP